LVFLVLLHSSAFPARYLVISTASSVTSEKEVPVVLKWRLNSSLIKLKS